MATERVPAFRPPTPLSEAEKALARSLDSLTAPQSANASTCAIRLNKEQLDLLRNGIDNDRSASAIEWGINSLREHTGVLPRLELAAAKFDSEQERTALLIDSIDIELRRQRLLAFLSKTEPASKEEDHPDIAATGAAAWVHNLRQEKSVRLSDRHENLDPL